MRKPQKEFPYIEEFRNKFSITDKTIFAYDHIIYSDYELTPDLYIHEKTHFKQQDKVGKDEWIKQYLESPAFMIEQEIQAYKNQLASIKNRDERLKVKIEAVKNLSNGLYGNFITFHDAFKRLDIR